MKTVSREIIKTIVIAVVIFCALRVTINHSIVIGSSMEPTLLRDEHILVSKVIYDFQEPKRGDIIVFKYPKDPDTEFIKRVIGLPGEIVEITDKGVYIHQENGNDIVLDEPYIVEMAWQSYTSDVIPDGEYFVLGDNRNNSGDSRAGWTVPRENIVGKACLVIWPPGEWGPAPNYSLPQD